MVLLKEENTLIDEYLGCSQDLCVEVVLVVVQEPTYHLRTNNKEVHEAYDVEKFEQLTYFFVYDFITRPVWIEDGQGYKTAKKEGNVIYDVPLGLAEAV